MSRPKLAISMGDPSGVGPEVILKAATVNDVRDEVAPVVFGDPLVLARAIRDLSFSLRLVELDPADDPPSAPGELAVVPVSRLDQNEWGWASPTAASELAQVDYVEAAFNAVSSGSAQALVTAPLTKSALHRAGRNFPGHTELLAKMCGVARSVMMLAGPSLKVVPVTTHVPLKDVPSLLTVELLTETLRTVNHAFQRHFGMPRPRLAVAGLNPHASENGLFGDEENKIIAPAVETASAEGIQAYGPFPADSVFHRAVNGEFDVVLGMYHDQALIPLKLLDFDQAVNVTLGLPIVRTSVDHGTAYDIAGRGVASARSMIEAIRLAGRMVRGATHVSAVSL